MKRVLKDKQDDSLDQDEMMDNVQKRNICVIIIAKTSDFQHF
jgi:hypothetical protein